MQDPRCRTLTGPALRVYAGLGCSERSRSLSRPVGCSCGLALGDSVQRTQDASGMQWTARWRNRGVLDGSEQTRVCVCVRVWCACVVCVCGVFGLFVRIASRCSE